MILRMEKIDRDWIEARLTGKRGEKAALARALGVGQHMVTKILSGERKLQQDEVPKVVAFFGGAIVSASPPHPFSDQDHEFLDALARMDEAERMAIRRMVIALAGPRGDDKSKEPPSDPEE